jgi:hypothetical protein
MGMGGKQGDLYVEFVNESETEDIVIDVDRFTMPALDADHNVIANGLRE